VVTPVQRTEVAGYLKESFKVPHARACRLAGCGRTGTYYHRRMPEKDALIAGLIREVVGHGRKGRNKVTVLVRREHPHIGAGRIRRVYEREGFSLHKRQKKRSAQRPANPVQVPLRPNVEWAMDFMSDSLADGRRFRTLNVVDHFNRECKGLALGHSLPSARVVRELEQLIGVHGKPQRIRTDNGPEFTSKRFQLWLKENSIQWSPIQPGSPQQNAIVERFNRTYREDVLDANIFLGLEQARDLTDRWCLEYNTVRPHQSLNNKTPMEHAN